VEMASSKRTREEASETISAIESEVVVLPVLEERLEVHKRTVDVGGVRVHKTVQEQEQTVDEALLREEVQVERVPVNRVLDGPVEIRHEGETLVIPVVEEVLVVEKRLMLKEEIRVTKTRRVEQESQRHTLRKETAVLETIGPLDQDSGPSRRMPGQDPSPNPKI